MKYTRKTMIALLFLFGGVLFAEDYRKADIISEYPTIFEVNIYRDSLYVFVNAAPRQDIPKHHFLRPLLQENKYIITYLMSNSRSTVNVNLLGTALTDEELKSEFIQDLQLDSLFNLNFLEMVQRYLIHKEVEISDFTMRETEIINIETALETMVRFWYPVYDSTSNRYSGYVCSGINGFSNSAYKNRNILLEATCYSSIMSKKLRLLRLAVFDFTKITKRVVKDMVSAPDAAPDMQELRQNVWERLEERRFVKSTLIKELKAKSGILPFIIKY